MTSDGAVSGATSDDGGGDGGAPGSTGWVGWSMRYPLAGRRPGGRGGPIVAAGGPPVDGLFRPTSGPSGTRRAVSGPG